MGTLKIIFLTLLCSPPQQQQKLNTQILDFCHHLKKLLSGVFAWFTRNYLIFILTHLILTKKISCQTLDFEYVLYLMLILLSSRVLGKKLNRILKTKTIIGDSVENLLIVHIWYSLKTSCILRWLMHTLVFLKSYT